MIIIDPETGNARLSPSKPKGGEERYQVCKQCEDFDSETKKCNICMCYMPLKTKLPFQSCPKDKW